MKTTMSLEEFSVYFWSYISTNAVTPLDRDINNRDFCDEVCYDCYRIYDQTGGNIDIICKLAENILFNVARYQPVLNTQS